MKNKKLLKGLNNHAVTGVLESLVAVGIVITLVVIFGYSISTSFAIQKDPAIDLKVKSTGIMNSLVGSSGQDNYLGGNWEEFNEYTAFGLCTTPTVEYGILNISSLGEVKVEDGPYPKINIGLDKTCFIAGTKVVMADETTKNIEDIKIGDFVKCYDTDKNIITDGKVTQVFHHLPEEMPDYYLLINGKLGVTPNHQFYINGKWIYASDLKIGDQLFGKDLDYKIFSIEKIFEKIFTYNIEVEGNHNYFIKIENNKALVHNDAGKDEVKISLFTVEPNEGTVPLTPYFNCSFYSGTPYQDGYYDVTLTIVGHSEYNYFVQNPLEVSPVTFNIANVVYDVIVTVKDSVGKSAEETVQIYTYAKGEGARPGFIAIDKDGLGPGKDIFFLASPNLGSESSAITYYWYIDGNLEYTENGNILSHQFDDYDPHIVKLVIKVTAPSSPYYIYNGSTVIKTVQANKVGPFQDELKPWILTGKNIFPTDDEHDFLSFNNDYYIKYTLVSPAGGTGKDFLYYLYEIKEKSSSDFPILDSTKLENITKFDEKEFYNKLWTSIGLSSKETLYNFAVEIEVSGNLYKIGGLPENVYAQESQTRKIQVYYPPTASSDGKSIDIHPGYKSGEITVYLFIGPSGLPD